MSPPGKGWQELLLASTSWKMLKFFPILDQIRMTRELQTRLVQKEWFIISREKCKTYFIFYETLAEKQAD